MELSQIADEVGVHKSTISRELSRNKGLRGWQSKQAQTLQDDCRQKCLNAQRLSKKDWEEVERLIRLDMSPEQTSQQLALEGGIQISHETIYLYVYADKHRNGDLWHHLRCQKSRRKRYASGQELQRWVGPLAERKSRYVLAGHIASHHAEGVTVVATCLLKPYKTQCHTITFDNGKEFARHKTIAVALETNIYFAPPTALGSAA